MAGGRAAANGDEDRDDDAKPVGDKVPNFECAIRDRDLDAFKQESKSPRHDDGHDHASNALAADGPPEQPGEDAVGERVKPEVTP